MKLFIPLLCVFVCLVSVSSESISISDIKALMSAGITGWKLFNVLFFPLQNKPKEPTKLLLRYQGGKRPQSKYIHYDGKVEGVKSEGPFENMQEYAQKLVRSKKIDVTEDCDLVYYELLNGENVPINVMDDEDLIQLMAKQGDEDNGNVRIIDIICYDTNTDPPTEGIKLQLYKMNEKAFNHIVAAQNDKTDVDTANAKKSLNEAGIGGFSVNGRGYAALDIDKRAFTGKIDALAKAWQWDEKITSSLNMVTMVGKQFNAMFNVWFAPSEWKIYGTYARFASFQTVEGKYSIYVATAKFEYAIPSSEREGDILDRIGVKGGGSIKGEYFDKMGLLLEGKALNRFKVDISRPEVDDYKDYGLKNKHDL